MFLFNVCLETLFTVELFTNERKHKIMVDYTCLFSKVAFPNIRKQSKYQRIEKVCT